MARKDEEPTRDAYKSDRAWRIARRRYFRKRQRATEQYRQKLDTLRASGYKPPTNTPMGNDAPRVETVPWAG